MSRFKVGSVTGWPASQQAAYGGRKPWTIWYVLDSADCYQIVRRFDTIGTNGHISRDPEADARAYATRLEQDYP